MSDAGEATNYGEDVSIDRVGGVFKKILREGTGTKSPQKNHEVMTRLHEQGPRIMMRFSFAPVTPHRLLCITSALFLMGPSSTAAATATTRSHLLLEPAASSKVPARPACCFV